MREAAVDIVRQLQDAGFTAFWVGGCVRDLLLNRTPGDYDIATSALPEDIEKLFRRTIAVGRKFGVMVVIVDGRQFQVATFRTEADYRDGRHPERVSFGDAMADARRRDFTINGLFYDPVREQLHDWVNGEQDLRKKIIRTIGSPQERFAEDHLRLLRAVRFATQLGFNIEAGTLTAIKQQAATIRNISAERVRDELIKLFQPPHAARGLKLLQESRLLEHVLPELVPTITCEQSLDFHPEGTVFEHILLILEMFLVLLSRYRQSAKLTIQWDPILIHQLYLAIIHIHLAHYNILVTLALPLRTGYNAFRSLGLPEENLKSFSTHPFGGLYAYWYWSTRDYSGSTRKANFGLGQTG